ncbi:hypothetical protein [Acidovorax sp. SUPP2825]|uniref:hypothetical protein n=1 Tax=Acidovorax sp. SUPP2825 TaxID=2920879 RepID=UPI0023DE54AA|nr:hypothetical protein [Acidovorax sp. SUPP2825]GKS95001.1 hypothetical protein AVAK2825_10720 [Acidovorax sp. SUPP2825]
MKKNRKRLAVISAIGIAAVVGVLMVSKPTPKTARPPTENLIQNTGGSHLNVAPSLDGAKQNPDEASSKKTALSAPILDRYNGSKDLREFVLYALQHPERGGTYYAAQALSQCKSIVAGKYFKQVQTPYSIGKNDEKYGAISKATDILRARCSNFIADELSDSRISEVKSNGLRDKDPLLLAEKAFLEKTTGLSNSNEEQKQNRKAALTQLLATQDPMVIEDIGPRIALQADPDTGMRGYKFNGHFYPLTSDTDVGLAIYLLPCGLGLNCDSTEFDVVNRCASGVECSDSRMDYVKNMLREKPGAYEKVMQVYEDMINAIARESVSSFL